MFTYGVPATDRVSELLEVAGEPGRVEVLDQVHALAVQSLKHA